MSDNESRAKICSRNKTLDVIKGALIIAIVIVHLMMLQETKTNGGGMPPIVAGLSTSLMLFFLVSGYLYKSGGSYKHKIKKRFLQLYLPVAICFIVLPLLYFAYLFILGKNPSMDGYEYILLRIFGNENMFHPYGFEVSYSLLLVVFSGYYFLQVMAISFLIFYACADRVLNDLRLFLATIVVLVAITFAIREFCFRPPLFLDLVPISAAFMFVGAFAAKHELIERIENGGWKHGWYWISFIAAAVLAVGLTLVFPPSTEFAVSEFGGHRGYSAFPYFIEALLYSYVMAIILSWIAKIPLFSDAIVFVGKHTLAILLFSAFVANLIVTPFFGPSYTNVFPSMPLPVAMGVALITIVVCAVAAEYVPKHLRSIREKGSL